MQYTEEQVSAAMELLPALWVKKYKIKNEAGIPLDLEGPHRFMYEPYNDLAQLQVFLKPPQIGATVKDIIKSFWVAKKMHKDIIYTLPTATDINDMAGGKINRLVAQNPILQQWVKNKDTVEQKGVGDNIIYYRGTFSAKQAMMVSSGLNIHDELDASDASVITQYETRLQAQEGGMRWYFSHPSLADHGVDVYWQQSDKKEWFVTCSVCTAEQVLAWPENIDSERKAKICSTCKATLSEKDIIAGTWKKTSEGPFSGYHVSQLMCTWISAEAILAAFNDPMKDEQYFYNYVLGLPYVGSENKISSDVVLKNVTAKTNTQEDTPIIGVDTGLPTYYTIMNKQGVFHYGKLKDASLGKDPYLELEGFLKLWPRAIIVADQGGDLTPMRILQGKYPGRVFLTYYRKDRKSAEMITWGEGDNYGTVVVDRNRMIQMLVEQMRTPGYIRLNGITEDWKEWASHFDNIYRVKKETPFGAEYAWERSGPDHYVHTLLYALVGMDKYGTSMATIVGGGVFDELPVGRFFDFNA